MTRDEAHRRAIEAGARALHVLECLNADADYVRQGMKPPEEYADPFIPTGKKQRDRLLREAETVITAYLAAMMLPIEQHPGGYDKGVRDMGDAADKLAAALDAMLDPSNPAVPDCGCAECGRIRAAESALAEYRVVKGKG